MPIADIDDDSGAIFHSEDIDQARRCFASANETFNAVGGLQAMHRLLSGQDLELAMDALMSAQVGGVRCCWGAVLAAHAAGRTAEEGEADSAALACMRAAVALLPQAPHEREPLVRRMAAIAQRHLLSSSWGQALGWLELAKAAAGNELPRAQLDQLILTEGYTLLEQLTCGPPVSRAVAERGLQRAAAAVTLVGSAACALGQHILCRCATLRGDVKAAAEHLQELCRLATDADFPLALTACRQLVRARRWDSDALGLYSAAAKRFPALRHELRIDLLVSLIHDASSSPSLLRLVSGWVGGRPGSLSVRVRVFQCTLHRLAPPPSQPPPAPGAGQTALPCEDVRVSALLARMVAEHSSGAAPISRAALASLGGLLLDSADAAFAARSWSLAQRLSEQQLALMQGAEGLGAEGAAAQVRLHRLAALSLLQLFDAGSAASEPAPAPAPGADPAS